MAKSNLIRTLYRNTDEFLSKEVTISGWIRTLRAMMVLFLKIFK